MACPTCDHTMHNIGQSDRGDNFFLCPRCGTVKIDAFGLHGDKVYVPALVERCREFGSKLRDTSHGDYENWEEEWKRLGIDESIHKPEDRPK